MCVSWICVLFWFVCVCVFADYMCFWGRGCLQDSERNTDRHGNFLSVLRMPPLGYGRIRMSAVRAVKVQRAHDLAAVKRAVPTIFNKAHAHTAFLPWSRLYCRCATSLRDVLPMVTRRCSMRVKRGPRAHAVAQGGAPAIDGRVLSTTKGVKLQRAPNMAAEKCYNVAQDPLRATTGRAQTKIQRRHAYRGIPSGQAGQRNLRGLPFGTKCDFPK